MAQPTVKNKKKNFHRGLANRPNFFKFSVYTSQQSTIKIFLISLQTSIYQKRTKNYGLANSQKKHLFFLFIHSHNYTFRCFKFSRWTSELKKIKMKIKIIIVIFFRLATSDKKSKFVFPYSLEYQEKTEPVEGLGGWQDND